MMKKTKDLQFTELKRQIQKSDDENFKHALALCLLPYLLPRPSVVYDDASLRNNSTNKKKHSKVKKSENLSMFEVQESFIIHCKVTLSLAFFLNLYYIPTLESMHILLNKSNILVLYITIYFRYKNIFYFKR